jgi:hypothetical protein
MMTIPGVRMTGTSGLPFLPQVSFSAFFIYLVMTDAYTSSSKLMQMDIRFLVCDTAFPDLAAQVVASPP